MDKEIVGLKIATLLEQIVSTKWYQFRKRKKLYGEAEKLAKEYNIKF